MTVERNSNIKYTSPPIHGQKRKGQQTLPLLPNTLPARVQVKLSDYAPLENPEKALALALRLKEIQERGEEVLLITRNEEIEELNRMRETTTDREQAEWAIAAPLVIPEIDELERRLAWQMKMWTVNGRLSGNGSEDYRVLVRSSLWMRKVVLVEGT